MWATKPYRDAVAIQKRIIDELPSAPLKDLAQLGKTFATLEMLKLRLRMKPAPKPIDTTKAEKHKPLPMGDFVEG